MVCWFGVYYNCIQLMINELSVILSVLFEGGSNMDQLLSTSSFIMQL